MQIAASLKGTIRRHPRHWMVAGALVLALLGFALYWFAPWNLFVDRRVDEALPTVGGDETPAAGEAPTEVVEEPTIGPGAGAQVSGPVTLSGGEFRGLEHGTSGTALVIELEDGSRFLRLEDLDTSNGPDLRVILTDQPVSDDWHVWDDGAVVDLGALEGNLGSSNYEIPESLDLSGFETAVIWCRRFSVGFGVAPLDAPTS